MTAVEGGSDVYTAALSTTRRYQTLNEAIHELLRENKVARLLQSSANEDDRQWPRYKFPLVKFNSGAA